MWQGRLAVRPPTSNLCTTRFILVPEAECRTAGGSGTAELRGWLSCGSESVETVSVAVASRTPASSASGFLPSPSSCPLRRVCLQPIDLVSCSCDQVHNKFTPFNQPALLLLLAYRSPAPHPHRTINNLSHYFFCRQVAPHILSHNPQL